MGEKCENFLILFGDKIQLGKVNYQHSIEESVVIIYDPERTSKGHLELKALRLTAEMMSMYRDGDFSPEALNAAGMSFNKMFQEVPILIRNSHLTNTLLCEMENLAPSTNHNQFLDLATSTHLENYVKLLMGCVDDLSQDANKFFNFQRQFAKQNQAKQQYLLKRQLENNARQARGEAPLGDEDIHKMFKPLQPP